MRGHNPLVVMRILVVFMLALCARAESPAPVLMMSLDGLSANQFSDTTMPGLWRLSEQGYRGRGIPPFPAMTFVSHATLATGCWPEHHGIVANHFYDPVLGLVEDASRQAILAREPLWTAATRSGIRTAIWHWPFSENKFGNEPIWRMEPFREGQTDAEALNFTEKALRDGARLVMTYLSGTDHEGHGYGPESPRVRKKLKQVDELLSPWVERALRSHPGLRIVLTADHGMATMQRRVDLPLVLKDWNVRILANGGSASIYLANPSDADAIKSRLCHLGFQAWKRNEIPEPFHLAKSSRVGDLLVLAPLGTWFSQGLNEKERIAELAGRKGAHGYAPDVPEMQCFLVILGAGGKGKLGEIQLWNLAPTIAAWLGIRWQRDPDGRPVPPLVGAKPPYPEIPMRLR